MIRKLSACVLCLVLLWACAAQAVVVTDMTGREVTLQEPVTRVVALTAADCEILCALGAGDTLVGRGEYCDYPESVPDVPAVASGYETNIEQIIALAPQVVLMGKMDQPTSQVEALESAGIRVVVSDAQDIEGVYRCIRMIGEVAGKEEEAAALAGGMREGFEEIGAGASGTGKTVYFEVSPLEWGLWTAGSGTFMDELARMVGLENAFSDVTGWAEVSQEQVIARDPDYIVTISMDYGEGPTPVEEILGREGWQDMKAVRSESVLNADSDEMSRPGPRLMDAARTLSDFVNNAG